METETPRKDQLKSQATTALKPLAQTIQEGAQETSGRLSDWVTEPEKGTDVTKRVLAVLAWIGVWIMAVWSEPLSILSLTFAGVLLAFWVNGRRVAKRRVSPPEEVAGKPAGSPVGEMPEPVEEVPAPPRKKRDDFWSMHTPSAPEKTLVDTHSDGLVSEAPTVRVRPGGAQNLAGFTKTQVIDASGVRTGVRGGVSDGSDGGQQKQNDQVVIYPASDVSGKVSEEPSGVSESQVTGVSGQLGPVVEQSSRTVTDSNIVTDHQEPVSLRKESRPVSDAEVLEMRNREGLSVRALARKLGIPSSSVQDMLTRAQEARRRQEISDAVTPAGPRVLPQPVFPGIWFGEDGHAQDVRLVPGCFEVMDEALGTRVLEFIRDVLLGKVAGTTDTWSVDLGSGFIVGELPDRGVVFSGCWSETGTVVISKVMFRE
ncbi:sigma-70 region 4 domain-containing protein [Rhodococcus qingshengii]|uniref:sigma-70 region 4 domain-containing protein n=1 Tax=Rhodococcus qingshengii TaxID=334542 RepID=UPI0035E2479F